MKYNFYNEDCITGAPKYIDDNSVDLIITDPPYGIKGDKLDKHYNRNENFVLDGYVEIPKEKYSEFSRKWILEAERVLKPGGSIYIISGYTNLIDILNGLKQTNLKEMNHIIWKYNFGVYTKTKFISSHYHILYYIKGKSKHSFNTFSRFASHEKNDKGGSKNYEDREDVWIINREYKPGKIKNKNELPSTLLTKIIQYSSNQEDVICDFFLGSFSTAKIAKGLNRQAIGFEISKNAFDYQKEEIKKIKRGYLLKKLYRPPENIFINQGKRLSDEEKVKVVKDYKNLISKGITKKQVIDKLSKKYGRGYWSILKIINNNTDKTLIQQKLL